MTSSFLNKCIATCLAVLLTVSAREACASTQPASPSNSQAQTAAPTSGTENTPSPAQAAPSQQPTNNPVGTAVAPYEPASGVTGSRPAGAVIAPAKQRRVRSILIKIGIVVGAAAAVGTVVALSHASPSQPH